MIQKRFVETNGRAVARVTFTLPSSTKSKIMYLVGDFKNWNPDAHPFRRDTKGRWTLTLDLELRRAYQFRYRRDDEEWMHDAQADAFEKEGGFSERLYRVRSQRRRQDNQ